MMYNMSMLPDRLSNEQGGGGVPLTTFLSYSVKVCIRVIFDFALKLSIHFTFGMKCT